MAKAGELTLHKQSFVQDLVEHSVSHLAISKRIKRFRDVIRRFLADIASYRQRFSSRSNLKIRYTAKRHLIRETSKGISMSALLTKLAFSIHSAVNCSADAVHIMYGAVQKVEMYSTVENISPKRKTK